MINEAIYHFSDQCRSGCNMYQIALFLIDPGIGKKKKIFFLSYSGDFRYKILSGSRNCVGNGETQPAPTELGKHKSFCSPSYPPKGYFNPTQAEEWRKYLSNLEAKFQRSSGLPGFFLPFLLLLLPFPLHCLPFCMGWCQVLETLKLKTDWCNIFFKNVIFFFWRDPFM